MKKKYLIPILTLLAVCLLLAGCARRRGPDTANNNVRETQAHVSRTEPSLQTEPSTQHRDSGDPEPSVQPQTTPPTEEPTQPLPVRKETEPWVDTEPQQEPDDQWQEPEDEPDDWLDPDDLVCQVVLNWYDANGTDISEISAMVEGQEPQGLLVRVFGSGAESMSTIGWYIVDPDTLMGIDFLFGDEIDFSPYR